MAVRRGRTKPLKQSTKTTSSYEELEQTKVNGRVVGRGTEVTVEDWNKTWAGGRVTTRGTIRRVRRYLPRNEVQVELVTARQLIRTLPADRIIRVHSGTRRQRAAKKEEE